MKLFPNFTSISFDYLLISWVTNYAHNPGVLTCLSYRELQALKRQWHTVWLKFISFLSEIMKKILWEVFTTLSCICNRQQNTPDSKFLLELTNAKQIDRQRLPAFYPANSLNQAPPCSIEQGFTNAFKTHTTKLLTNENFGSKFVFKNWPLFCWKKCPNPLNYFSKFAVNHSISNCLLAVQKFLLSY